MQITRIWFCGTEITLDCVEYKQDDVLFISIAFITIITQLVSLSKPCSLLLLSSFTIISSLSLFLSVSLTMHICLSLNLSFSLLRCALFLFLFLMTLCR